ncbi:alpha/beta hydrolase [Amycolatopsis thermoflava]|uniref:alpha/beta hydrolase n=1 Tax=Amycolatopsis thermoflava TaxID=84480 RepID=UPI0036664CF7
MRVVFVHGALVGDAAWWWSRMTPLLPESVAVELPSCGGGGDLYTDVAAVRAALDDGPAVLCGHSYGGVVMTEAAADHRAARHLVYVDSYLPDVGESLADVTGGVAPVEPAGEGLVSLRPSLAPRYVHDCDPEVAADAMTRLVPQTAAAFTQPVRAAAWRSLPSTYVVCADDPATPPEVQREQAKRAGTVVEMACGHHPFLTRPAELAAVLRQVG